MTYLQNNIMGVGLISPFFFLFARWRTSLTSLLGYSPFQVWSCWGQIGRIKDVVKFLGRPRKLIWDGGFFTGMDAFLLMWPIAVAHCGKNLSPEPKQSREI